MAMIDIAEDDLDEMMHEEAEDIFYEDGRLNKDPSVRAGVGLQVGRRAKTAAPRLQQVHTGLFVTCGCDWG